MKTQIELLDDAVDAIIGLEGTAYSNGLVPNLSKALTELRSRRSRMENPVCECGKPGSWRGPREGLREFACQECWNAPIVYELREHFKSAAPYSTTFIDGIPEKNKPEVQHQLQQKFESWWNSWIAPRLDELEGKGRQ